MTHYVDGILLGLQPGGKEVSIPHVLTVVHTVRQEKGDTTMEDPLKHIQHLLLETLWHSNGFQA